MTPGAGALFLIACLGMLAALLVTAALLEAITRDLRGTSPTGTPPSRSCGCKACRGTRAPRRG